MTKPIHVEVVYATPTQQLLLSLNLIPPITLEQAIVQSGILAQCPEIDLTQNKVGIFSKISQLDQILRDNDRVEIYRDLIADPKTARKKRAAQKDED
jgi:putative ubiquitin-RnfH superfamily antitoxin RatB of RatAB toxin-antitoxin module